MNPYSETPAQTHEQGTTYQKSRTNRIGISFIITAFFDQILVCLMYGLLYDFNPDVRSSQEFDDLLLISIMTILVIVGNSLLIQDLGSITHTSPTPVSQEWLFLSSSSLSPSSTTSSSRPSGKRLEPVTLTPPNHGTHQKWKR